MSVQSLRALLEQVDIEDFHEFATAYVDHVESSKAPMSVTAAMQQWVTVQFL